MTTSTPRSNPQVTVNGWELHPTGTSYFSEKTGRQEWRANPYESVVVGPDGTEDYVRVRGRYECGTRLYYGWFHYTVSVEIEESFSRLDRLREHALRCYVDYQKNGRAAQS